MFLASESRRVRSLHRARSLTVFTLLVASSAMVTQGAVAQASASCATQGRGVIGGLIGESPVAHIAMGTHGVLLSHPYEGSVTRLQRDLTRAAILGRTGRGPGEFEWISAIGFAGDEVWIYDGTLNRATVFAASGALRREFDLRSVARQSGRELRLKAISSEGSLFGAYMPVRAARRQLAYSTSPLVSLRRVEGALWRVDTLAVVRARAPSFTVAVSSTAARSLLVPELHVNDLVSASADGRWLAWTTHTVSSEGRPSAVVVWRLDTRSGARSSSEVPISVSSANPSASARRRYLEMRLADLAGFTKPDEFKHIITALLDASGGDWAIARGLVVENDGSAWLAVSTSTPNQHLWRRVGGSETRSSNTFRADSDVVSVSGGQILVACNLGEVPIVRQHHLGK